MADFPKQFQPSKYEDPISRKWEASGAYKPSGKGPAFTISMPPPNATGSLHVGHAAMLAIEDIMIRYHRMKGDRALWVPGTDHAAIASQNKVESMLWSEEKKTRHDLGRRVFVKRVEKYVKDSQNTIRKQIKKMGSSCDWSRERYTMDPGLTHAVRTVFVRMYGDGLIYRGDRIVNWCTRCKSTLADDEVKYVPEVTKFYYLKYGPVIIGTARPETKFADKVIIVHPDDKRYKKYAGKKMMVPWISGNVEATFIADKAADMSLGSGAMTITPGHSFVDFELAQKYRIPVLKIIDEDGNLTDEAGKGFAAMPVKKAREKVVGVLQKKGLVDHIDEKYEHNLSVCYRCDTPVEPLPSRQWFVNVNKKISLNGKKLALAKKKKTASLKEIAVSVVRSSEIKVVPDRFDKTYYHWMTNLRDWCISRQIWFGHRIPVWYCCAEPIVSVAAPKKCPHCSSKKLRQDPDTLDTWFSSGLWTFSTLGWPDKTKDLKTFHPTSVLETGYDILFFWIARMVLMSTYAMGEVPFRNVYLHGLVRDKRGDKMSKSLGNGIDPLDMIAKYGTDAVRLSLLVGSTPGNDVRLSEEKIASYRNFTNKIWNASRYAALTIENIAKVQKFSRKQIKTTADRWIISELQNLISDVTDDLEKFRFSEAGLKIYNFTWGECCNWYVEVSKTHPSPAVLVHVLKTLLTLLHPFVPFVTEAIWKQFGGKGLLISVAWPKPDKSLIDKKALGEMGRVKEVIGAIRALRNDHRIPEAKYIAAEVHAGKHLALLQEKSDAIKKLAKVGELHLMANGARPQNAFSKALPGGMEVFIPRSSVAKTEQDQKSHLEKLQKELHELQNYVAILEKKLANKGFTTHAPESVVAGEKAKLSDARAREEKLLEKLGQLA